MILKRGLRAFFMPSIWLWLLMVLPFALWGTAMTAMAPLLATGGPWLVAGLRLFPAGLVLLLWVVWTGRSVWIDGRDWGWFALFTVVDACLFQGLLAIGLDGTGAGLGSVLIDSQPLLVALLARGLFAELINPVGWVGLGLGLAGIFCLGVPGEFLNHWWLLADPPAVQQLLQPGEVWMLLASLAMAIGTVLIRFASRHSDPVAVTAWHMVLGGIPLLLLFGFENGVEPIGWSCCRLGPDGICKFAGQCFGLWTLFLVCQSPRPHKLQQLGILDTGFCLGDGRLAVGRAFGSIAVGRRDVGLVVGDLRESASPAVGTHSLNFPLKRFRCLCVPFSLCW
jgi:drug/metabolite transporter (DMT)-like permease